MQKSEKPGKEIRRERTREFLCKGEKIEREELRATGTSR